MSWSMKYMKDTPEHWTDRSQSEVGLTTGALQVQRKVTRRSVSDTDTG